MGLPPLLLPGMALGFGLGVIVGRSRLPWPFLRRSAPSAGRRRAMVDADYFEALQRDDDGRADP